MFRDQNASMTVTSVSGHMMGIDFDEAYRGWHSCKEVDLFQAPLKRKAIDASRDIEKTLRREAKNHDTLLLWLDCDLEGEAIAFEVIEVPRKQPETPGFQGPVLSTYSKRYLQDHEAS